MTDRLKVDVDLLLDTGNDLDAIVREFDGADTSADRVADDVGDDHLADTIREFSREWTNRREKMKESIANLAELTTAVGAQFQDIDKQLGASVEGGSES